MAMAFLPSNPIPIAEVGLRLLLSSVSSSNVVVRTACCSVGVALPVYSTFKAIESGDQNEKERCLIYWAAYGSFSLIEVFSDKLISWVPMYYHLKFAFLVWLQLPTIDVGISLVHCTSTHVKNTPIVVISKIFRGAKMIYSNHLRPFLMKHQSRIDRVMGLAYFEMAKLISSHQSEFQFARNILMKIIGSDTSGQGDRVEEPTSPTRDNESDPTNQPD